MKFYILIVNLFLMLNVMSQNSNTLIYVGDPMCSWCYGISEEVNKLKESLGDNIEFKMVMGGLRPYNTETMADLGDFLQHHWEDVSKASGQEFNYEILSDTSFVYDTEPPSRAIVAVRQLAPEKEWLFFKEVQKAFYLENKNTHLAETYLPILDELGVNSDEFLEFFNSEELKNKIKDDFRYAGSLGVSSFPTVVLLTGHTVTPIANGFSTFEKMDERINKVMENAYDGK